MVYRPRPPKKWFLSYIMPFLLIVIIFVWWIYAFKKLLFKDDSNSSFFNESFAILETEKWTTEVMLAWTSDWKTAPVKMKLFKWDAIQTYKKEIKIDLPNNIKILVDKNSSLVVDKIEANNSYRDIEMTLMSWRIWVQAQRMINPKSKLSINSQNILITTRWWIFSIEPNTVRTVEGDSLIDIVENDRVIWHVNIWIWQELILGDWEISRVKIWQMPEIKALSDEFKISAWYKRNYWSINWIMSSDEQLNAIKDASENNWSTWEIVSEVETTEKIETKTGNDDIQTKEQKDIAEKERIDEQSKQEDKEESNEVITWELTIDIENTEVELKKDQMFTIEWKTSSNAAYVLVNWYKLKKFVKWDNTYKYNAMINWWNLIVWENTIKIETLDSRSRKIEVKQITLIVIEAAAEAVIDEKTNETQDKTEEIAVPKRTTTLQILSPKEWEIIAWDVVEIKWIAPEWTISVFFWEYKLSKFKKWDTEFIYRASWDYWNLSRWEKNSYIIKALDVDWNVIESVNFSFFSEEK